jgi:hypothetical protein
VPTAVLKHYIRAYFVACGFLAHIALLLVLCLVAYFDVSDHWRIRHVLGPLQAALDPSPVFQIPRLHDGQYDFSSTPTERWLKVRQLSADDPAVFDRQGHSGSAWDSKRQRLIIFGSNTHGKNWDNSIHNFDLDSLSWSINRPPDERSSYRVSQEGLPLAGYPSAPAPWAMHTFDALAYDPSRESLIVASAPKHLKPGRFSNSMEGLWDKIREQPTWLYSIDSDTWRPAKGPSVDFFPYAIAYDSCRQLVVGFRPGKIYEFDMPKEAWQKVAKNTMWGYHTAAVYDAENRAFILFGNHEKSNAVFVYRPGDSESMEMPTPGIRPPGDEHVPLAYDSDLGATVALVDNGEVAETWVYSLPNDAWRQIETANFPFKLGMNYHLQYSEKHNLLLLVANQEHQLPSVWILRL